MAEAALPGAGRLVAGRYRLAGELGRGGMGVVWQAGDELIGRQVAIKELRAPAGLPPADRDVFTQRALAEARNAARVRHPGAVTLHDVIPATGGDDAVYLVMELIRAPTLAAIVAGTGPLPPTRAADIGLQLLDVLDTAHELGVIHRDIKPANIMIEPTGRARLADFGIAYTTGDPRLTRTGIMGTQAYLAPELFENAPLTPAADLWSLGATLYHATSGTGPFDRDTTAAVLRAILIEELPAPVCGPPLATAITALLNRDPDCRGASQQVRPLLQQAASPASVPHPAWQQHTTNTPATPPRPRPAWNAPVPPPGRTASTAGPAGPPPRAGWEMPGTTRTPGAVPALTPAPAPAPAMAPGGTSLSSKPRLCPGWLLSWPRAVLGCVGLVATVVIAEVVPGILFTAWPAATDVFLEMRSLIFLAGLAALITCVSMKHRWWVLRFDAAGITSRAGKKRLGAKHKITIQWEQVTWLGPYVLGHSTYLGVCASGTVLDATVPVPLCPLGTRDFQPAALREAILRYLPAANLDPQL